MPHSLQAKKRVRQSEKGRVKNKSLRSEIKTIAKSMVAKIQAKEMDAAKALFQKAVSKLDKAARQHVYHKNAAARQKSRLAGVLNAALGK